MSESEIIDGERDGAEEDEDVRIPETDFGTVLKVLTRKGR